LGNIEIGIQSKMDLKLNICALDSVVQDKVYWRALADTEMNFRVLQKMVKSLIRREIIRFSGWVLLYGVN
jgi:hypothetical protein